MTTPEPEQNSVRKIAPPVKLIAPEPGRYYIRSQLLTKLTDSAASPGKVWISSPGGAGKTALVRNFLLGDSRPLLWYQVDNEDRDPANLFFYLAQAVPEERPGLPALPQFTHEHLPNLEVFCRNFCRALLARTGKGSVLVFDDLQEGPGELLFGPFLSALMWELPSESSLLVISREEPYPRFARDRLNGSLAHLNWDDLRLSAEETRHFLSWSLEHEPQPKTSQRAYELTQGWLAGLLLFMSNPEEASRPEVIPPHRTDLLFDYFAGEIFARLPVAKQNFLYLCSLLPSIDVTLAEKLTGRSDAGEVLQELVRENHFTYRISSSQGIYRIHPLFQQFLRSRAEQALGAKQLGVHRVAAAGLLIEGGQIEQAAELMIDSQAWTPLIELISSHAEALLRQCRTQTLFQWLEALPAPLRESAPWLCYWRGNCLLATDPAQALLELTRAFELFESEGDAVGSMLSWGMVVNAIVIVWDDYGVLDQWIERFDRLLEHYTDYPSRAIESLMVQGICKSLAWRYPARADLPGWAERLHQLVTSSSDSDFRLLAGSNLVLYHIVSGSIATAKSLVELLNSDLQSTAVGPLKKLIWLATRGVLEWVLLDRFGSQATLEAGRSIIKASGIHVLDVRLFTQGIALGLSTGDLSLARKLFVELQANPIVTSLDHAQYALLQADLSLMEGDAAKAVVLAETAVKRATDGGNAVIKAMSLCVYTLALYEVGEFQRAFDVLDEGLELASGMSLFKISFWFLGAFFSLEKGDGETALPLLREGFGLAARQGYLNFLPWRDTIMSRLCQEAIGADVEVEYVTHLAECHNLTNVQLSPPLLSPKEMETLGWVQEGKTTWEIAKILGVSEGTVKFHVGNILRKLGAGSRPQAVAIALKAGLLNG